MQSKKYDAIVIGGGFYGVAIAIYLKKTGNFPNIALLEQENGILLRASYNNQARIHNGYHYPRSFTTAFRSRVNFPRFIKDYAFAVKKDFTKLYAIPKQNSKITVKQFEHFCREIGVKLTPAPPTLHSLFNARLIEKVFLAEEYVFDSTKLAEFAKQELSQLNIDIQLRAHVNDIVFEEKQLNVKGENFLLNSPYVFNCTYSGLNQYSNALIDTQTKLKHEITEMALLELPHSLKNIGVTVMDGAFFSLMPFPANQLHTLSHVRYTPHLNWFDQKKMSPYQKLLNYKKETRIERMLRDTARYIPTIKSARYVDSLFEIKTILLKNEVDDGRPILFEKHAELPGLFSILGGKIDNIYDVFLKLEAELLKNST